MAFDWLKLENTLKCFTACFTLRHIACFLNDTENFEDVEDEIEEEEGEIELREVTGLNRVGGQRRCDELADIIQEIIIE